MYAECFNTDDGIRRAAIYQVGLLEMISLVSIPMTVLGGLQSSSCGSLCMTRRRFNTDDGIRRAAIIQTRFKTVSSISFNTDDGIRRAAIRKSCSAQRAVLRAFQYR